jgi:hypothetical protein
MATTCSRVLLVAAAATVLLGGAAAAAEKDPLLRYHPAAGEVAGLTVVEGSHQHGAGDGLTAIYNGGYQRYTRAGVKRASQRYYKLDGQTVELVIHELKSEAAARNFFAASCKDGKAAVEPLKAGKKAARVCAASADGAGFGYLALGKYFLSSSVDKAVDQPARALLKAAADRLAGVKPKGAKQ